MNPRAAPYAPQRCAWSADRRAEVSADQLDWLLEMLRVIAVAGAGFLVAWAVKS